MGYTVVKAFKTINRKFAPGDTVSASDIDPRSAFSLDDLEARGFVRTETVDGGASVVDSQSEN